MAVPPAYADLGKSAKDIFNKGYGNWKKDKRHLYKCVFADLKRSGLRLEMPFPSTGSSISLSLSLQALGSSSLM